MEVFYVGSLANDRICSMFQQFYTVLCLVLFKWKD
jgi:hypothetical protein